MAVDWLDKDVQNTCAVVFSRMVDFLLGVYIWYFCLTFADVEMKLIIGRLKLSLVILVPYLMGRYCAVATSFLLILISRGTPLRHCVRVNASLPVLVTVITTCASTNILLRPLALWKKNKVAVAFIIFLAFGHWGLGLGVSISRYFVVKYGPENLPCRGVAPRGPHPDMAVIAFYLYTMLWDLTILLLTMIGLLHQAAARSSPLWTVVYAQGIQYLIITSAVNIPMLIFSWLNLNGTMNIMFAGPGGIVSIMASSSAVTSLLRMKQDDSESLGPARIPVRRAAKGGYNVASKSTEESYELTSQFELPSTSRNTAGILNRAELHQQLEAQQTDPSP